MQDVEITFLLGKKINRIQLNWNAVVFCIDFDIECKMYHRVLLDENVTYEGLNGDINDLIESPIIYTKKTSTSGRYINGLKKLTPKLRNLMKERKHEFYTLTIFELRTEKGSVIFKWFGSYSGVPHRGEVNFVALI